MAWDAKLHKTICMKDVNVSESTTLVVEKYSYDGGAPKVKVGALIRRSNGEVNHAPFRGVDANHAAALAAAILEVAGA